MKNPDPAVMLATERAQNRILFARVKELEAMTTEDVKTTIPAKRVRGPRKPKTPLEMASTVYDEAKKGWTHGDYDVFDRVFRALRGTSSGLP